MKGSTFGSEEVDEMVSSSEIGKGDNKKNHPKTSDSSKINEDVVRKQKRIEEFIKLYIR